MEKNKTPVEYIWIDTDGDLRSKSKIVYFDDELNFPDWNFDGSSTKQAETIDSEIILKPKSIFKDPFRSNIFKKEGIEVDCYLVLCDCYDRNDKPIKSNTRFNSDKILEQFKEEQMWFGLEQEFVLKNAETDTIVGWPPNGLPEPQGKYYCGVGSDRTFYRNVVEEHFAKCIAAGIKIAGVNEEVLPGQWEFQIGPCEGIAAADQLWVARYILHRVCENYNLIASFDPKPVDGEWNGSGMHTNFSYKKMRDVDNLGEIHKAIEKLSKKHMEHIQVYGDNSKRLTGLHETSKIDTFTFGISDRTASIRIPSSIFKTNNRYLEDRRPSANADPYQIISIITSTVHEN